MVKKLKIKVRCGQTHAPGSNHRGSTRSESPGKGESRAIITVGTAGSGPLCNETCRHLQVKERKTYRKVAL